MIAFPVSQRIFVRKQFCDMRLGFEGLSNITRNEFKQDPCSGDLFVFLNRKRNRLKILVWDHGGFWLLCKRLEKGCFPRIQNNNDEVIVSRTDFMMMLDGIEVIKIKKTKRYEYLKH